MLTELSTYEHRLFFPFHSDISFSSLSLSLSCLYLTLSTHLNYFFTAFSLRFTESDKYICSYISLESRLLTKLRWQREWKKTTDIPNVSIIANQPLNRYGENEFRFVCCWMYSTTNWVYFFSMNNIKNLDEKNISNFRAKCFRSQGIGITANTEWNVSAKDPYLKKKILNLSC